MRQMTRTCTKDNIMNFNSKQTYLAAVAEWQLRYLDTIEGIRQTKRLFKNAQRAFSTVTPIDFYNTNSAQREAYFSKYHPMEALRAEHKSLVAEATELIVERQLGREEAGRQMELARTP
jgi:hypothetical protein